VPQLAPKVVASRLAGWRGILRGSIVQARDVLRRVLAEPLTFRKLQGGLTEFEAPTTFSRLFVGFPAEEAAGAPPAWVKVPDGRGHEAGSAEARSLELRYSAVLKVAEGGAYEGKRPWTVAVGSPWAAAAPYTALLAATAVAGCGTRRSRKLSAPRRSY
jgi:hypothetical protein